MIRVNVTSLTRDHHWHLIFRDKFFLLNLKISEVLVSYYIQFLPRYTRLTKCSIPFRFVQEDCEVICHVSCECCMLAHYSQFHLVPQLSIRNETKNMKQLIMQFRQFSCAFFHFGLSIILSALPSNILILLLLERKAPHIQNNT